jgi:hypothetical protein
MRTIIAQRLYEPESDKVVATYRYGDGNDDDPVMEYTTLHVTNSGHFYLSGCGGPLSRWRRKIDGIFDYDEGLEPLSLSEALAWAKRHDPSSKVIFDLIKYWTGVEE